MTLPPSAPTQTTAPAGCITFTINLHLPWVIHHGSWPHGLEWLLELAAETCLPLLRLFDELEREQVPTGCNLAISPILLEQFAHPLFRAELPRYLQRKIDAAREDEACFRSTGAAETAAHYAALARHWQQHFTQLLSDFDSLDRDLIAGFRHHYHSGRIDVLTTAAGYGYLPLLGTEESLRAQVRLAVAAHTRHFGRAPSGFWLPECGYRPAGRWEFPVPQPAVIPSAFNRAGIEQFLAENGIEFFFADAPLVAAATRRSSPSARRAAAPPINIELESLFSQPARALYQPYFVNSPAVGDALPPVAVFARDPQTAALLWGEGSGYPAGDWSLHYHSKRWPGGHRYWRNTAPGLPQHAHQTYDPNLARDDARAQADDFVARVEQTLAPCLHAEHPPVLTALFDADLLGRWWFEGAEWLGTVVRTFARRAQHAAQPILPVTAVEYLHAHRPAGYLSLAAGSWGVGGSDDAWLNPETRFLWEQIYPAERALCEVADALRAGDNPLTRRIAAQLGRELLLLQASDWPFFITTGAAADYAHSRIATHAARFHELLELCHASRDGDLSEQQLRRFDEIEIRDTPFPEISSALWSPRI